MILKEAKDYSTKWIMERFLNWALSNAVLIATAVIASGMGVINWKLVQDNFLFFYIFSILVIVPSSFYIWNKIQELKEKRKIKYAFSERHIFHCINEDGTITHTRTGKLTVLKSFLTHYYELFLWTGGRKNVLGIEYEINGKRKKYPLKEIKYNKNNQLNFIALPFKSNLLEAKKDDVYEIKTTFKLDDKEKLSEKFISWEIFYPLEVLTLCVKFPPSMGDKKVMFEEYKNKDSFPLPIKKEDIPVNGGLATKTIENPRVGNIYRLEW